MMVKGETTLFRNVAPKEQTIVNLSGKADFYLTQLWRASFNKAPTKTIRENRGKLSGSRTGQTHCVFALSFFFSGKQKGG